MDGIKEKLNYEKEIIKNLEEKIKKEGGRFDAALVKIDTNLEVIKEILFKSKIINEEEFEIKYLRRVKNVLKNILEEIRKLKRKKQGLIVAKSNINLNNFKEKIKA